MPEKGLRGEAAVQVAAGNTAKEVGSGSVPVFATPMLVALMESAAINALQGRLPEGQTTVGTKVDVSHTAATPVGMTVTAQAELLEADGRRLLFAVMAQDEAGLVGEGRHERFIVDTDKFLSRAEKRKGHNAWMDS
ncbi:MAG: thioesterase family protein [Firmicutes bacterium]|nr:thioesterase family protein [Bacillota bacterium]